MSKSAVIRVGELAPQVAASPSAGVCVATVREAAERAEPGDTVRIAPGVYRERVVPRRGGTADAPIRYVADGGPVVIRGSVAWTPRWRPRGADDPVQFAEVDPALFPATNPLSVPLKRMKGLSCGQLFVDGEPMLEVADDAALNATPGSWRALDHGRQLAFHPPGYAIDLAGHLVELTVHDRLFAPDERGLGHIHLEGLTFEHCGNQFPSGFWKGPGEDGWPQAGAVGTRGGHDWVIRRCTIRHAKAIGLDCGDEGGFDIVTGRPIRSTPGYEGVGRHLVTGNTITDNGACGIAAAGSRGLRIVDNRVERNNALGFRAPETAGIKVHFFFDGLIADNLVGDNDAAGIWLDNQWYGSRVTRNVCLNNQNQGIFIEMGEGPVTVDHNVCALTRLGDGIYGHDSSGVRIVHNLCFGNTHFGVYLRIVTDRRLRDSEQRETLAAARDNTILNNVLIDNYRGAISLPEADGDRVRGNASNHNLFIDGTQWQWEGRPPHQFVLNRHNGRHAERLTTKPDAAAPHVLDVKGWREQGYDPDSRFITMGDVQLEDGAPAKGWIALGSRSLALWLAEPRHWLEARVPAQPESGTPRVAVPGPDFITRHLHNRDDLTVPLWPPVRPAGTWPGRATAVARSL